MMPDAVNRFPDKELALWGACFKTVRTAAPESYSQPQEPRRPDKTGGLRISRIR
jgi:hypothetical protein